MTKIFLTAALYMLLLSMNTICLTKGQWWGVAALSFAISFLWCANVKRLSVHSMGERITYATGAMIGALTGLKITTLILA